MRELLVRNFAENPVWVYVVLAAAEAVLVLLWRRGVVKRTILLAVCPVLAIAVVAVSTLIVTDRERIEKLTEEVVSHAERLDIPAISDYVDDDYNYGGMNKKLWYALSTAFAKIYRFKSISIKELEVTFPAPGQADVLLRVFVHMDPEAQGLFPSSYFYYTSKLAWTRNAQGQWKITAMIPLRYNYQDLTARSLLEWLRLITSQ